VTNYAKKYNIAFMNTQQKYVIVYLSYKSHLKAYSKKMFDPFCRWKRIKFHGVDTTVGQLNFFEWAISDGILAYLDTHKDNVHVDMESRLQELKDGDEKPEIRRRRHELSHSATKSLARHDVSVKVSFDYQMFSVLNPTHIYRDLSPDVLEHDEDIDADEWVYSDKMVYRGSPDPSYTDLNVYSLYDETPNIHLPC
jgi:hypothetical protein